MRWGSIAAALISVVLFGQTAAHAQAGAGRRVLNDVHTDVVDVRLEDGKLRLQTRIGNSPHEFAQPDEVIFQLKDVPESALAVPDDPAYTFLGAPGSPVWIAPEVQDPALLFAGWNTESIPAGALKDDTVTLELTDVDGPGRVELFQSASDGTPIRKLSSADAAHKVMREPVHSHAHANWVFTALGRYELTLRAIATTAAGQAIQSAPATYVWFVGGKTAGDVPGETRPSPSPSRSRSLSPTPKTSTVECLPKTTRMPILDQGHADYAVRLVDGRLESGVKDGAAYRDPSRVVLHLPQRAEQKLPGGFGFLGAAGSSVWQIPQTQRAGILWLGWSTESVPAGQIRGQVSWSLTKVSGPGRFAIYEYDTFGSPRVLFHSGDGLPDTMNLNPGTHAHGNWAFTKPGVYRLTFTHRATLTSGRQVSDSETVTFAVGDTDPEPLARRTSGCGDLPTTGRDLTLVAGAGALLLAVGTLVVLLARRRRSA